MLSPLSSCEKFLRRMWSAAWNVVTRGRAWWRRRRVGAQAAAAWPGFVASRPGSAAGLPPLQGRPLMNVHARLGSDAALEALRRAADLEQFFATRPPAPWPAWTQTGVDLAAPGVESRTVRVALEPKGDPPVLTVRPLTAAEERWLALKGGVLEEIDLLERELSPAPADWPR